MDTKKKHSLFLPHWYPHPKDPLYGLFVRRHAECIVNSYRVSVLYPCALEDGPKKMKRDTSFNGGIGEFRVYYRASNFFIKPLRQLINLYKYRKAAHLGLAEIFRVSGKPDICHVEVLSRPAWIALWLKRNYKTPFIISEHWSRYLPENNSYSGFLRKLFVKKAIKEASAVTAVTDRLRNAMRSHELKHQHFSILPNGIDSSQFSISKTEKNSKAKKRIIHVSCFEDQSKNISGILDAIVILKEKRTDFELVFVGDGVDYESLKQKAENLELISLGLAKFTGALENKKLIEAYHSSDFSVLFSNYETFGVPIIESLMCGLPVVTTLAGGISDYFDKKYGYEVNISDSKNLAEKLDKMLDNYSQFDAQEMRESVCAKFSYEAVGKKILKLYDQALSK